MSWRDRIGGRTALERRFGFALAAAAIGFAVFAALTAGSWLNAPAAAEAAGRRVQIEHVAKHWTWVAVALNAALSAALWLTRGWWVEARAGFRDLPAPGRPSGAYVWAVMGLVAAGVALRVPRLDLSLYNDEAYNFRRYIAGEYRVSKDAPEGAGETWRQMRWTQTLWGNDFGNNGVLFSSLARLSYDGWKAAHGLADGEVCEPALRLPALLAGLIFIPVAASVSRRVSGGSDTAGIFGAFLAAVHPWLVRYGSEARAYSIMLLFATLALYCLMRALGTARWRWWLGFAAAQWLMLYAYAGSLYYAAALNGAAGLMLAGRALQRGGDWRALWQFAAANLLSAMVYLLVNLPSLPQIAAALAKAEVFNSGVRVDWWADYACYAVAGMPWFDIDPDNPVAPFGERQPYLVALGACAFGILAVLGFAKAAKRGPAVGVPILAAAGAPILAFAHAYFSGGSLLIWYAIFGVPALCLAVAVGAGSLAGRSRGMRAAAWPAVLAAAIAVPMVTPLSRYLATGKEGLREVVETMRGGRTFPEVAKAGPPPPAVAFWSDDIYDPSLIVAFDAPEIEALAKRCAAEGEDFYVAFGFRLQAVRTVPETVRYIEESGDFELVRTIYGLEDAQFTQRVFRYVGGAEP